MPINADAKNAPVIGGVRVEKYGNVNLLLKEQEESSVRGNDRD